MRSLFSKDSQSVGTAVGKLVGGLNGAAVGSAGSRTNPPPHTQQASLAVFPFPHLPQRNLRLHVRLIVPRQESRCCSFAFWLTWGMAFIRHGNTVECHMNNHQQPPKSSVVPDPSLETRPLLSRTAPSCLLVASFVSGTSNCPQQASHIGSAIVVVTIHLSQQAFREWRFWSDGTSVWVST